MAVVKDLSGNNPFGSTRVDPAQQYNVGLQGVKFLGDQHILTLGAASVQSEKFSNKCRAIRVAPEGDCHYAIGENPTAVKNGTQFLGAGAVEVFPVTPGHKIAVIQNAAETNVVIVTEDRS